MEAENTSDGLCLARRALLTSLAASVLLDPCTTRTARRPLNDAGLTSRPDTAAVVEKAGTGEPGGGRGIATSSRRGFMTVRARHSNHRPHRMVRRGLCVRWFVSAVSHTRPGPGA